MKTMGFAHATAIRVLGLITLFHPEMNVPVSPLLTALDFPYTTDRNKASWALEPLSRKDQNKKEIAKRGGRILLEMLKLNQPNNHDPAYAILKNVSGQDFGERNYDAWEQWLISR